jgi:hypothetical protein
MSSDPAAPVPCGCGRSATGFCTGLHELAQEEWDRMLLEDWTAQEPPEDEPL